MWYYNKLDLSVYIFSLYMYIYIFLGGGREGKDIFTLTITDLLEWRVNQSPCFWGYAVVWLRCVHMLHFFLPLLPTFLLTSSSPSSSSSSSSPSPSPSSSVASLYPVGKSFLGAYTFSYLFFFIFFLCFKLKHPLRPFFPVCLSLSRSL